ncbi:hypothetical protein AgCh_011407 [Apium graveolens]
MDKSHPLTTPMVIRSLEPDKDPFRPREDDEEVLGPEIPYLGAIGALMYLANNTRPYIAFVMNLLARFSSAPIIPECHVAHPPLNPRTLELHSHVVEESMCFGHKEFVEKPNLDYNSHYENKAIPRGKLRL